MANQLIRLDWFDLMTYNNNNNYYYYYLVLLNYKQM